MKKTLLLVAIALISITTFAQNKAVVDINSNITSNRTFHKDTIYVLHGLVRVINSTLTVNPGTVVKGGLAPDNSNATALVIQKDAKIMAIGTKEEPIIFTSSLGKGLRNYGDWGGIVFFGDAPVNAPNAKYENGVVQVDITDANIGYGGNNPTSNQGELKYVRIEFAGYPFETDRELNSLTMCAVGSGTKISYVQCSYNNDDAFEWFGGNVNVNHIFAYKTNDDDFDTDNGFSGNVQFAVSVVDTAIADKSTKNGFESDNDATGSYNNPLTKAVFSNVTLVGPFRNKTDVRNTNFGRGAHIRRNSALSVFNSVFIGWAEGIRMDAATTLDNFTGDTATFDKNVIAGCLKDIANAGSADSTATNNYLRNTKSNTFLANTGDVNLMNPWGYQNGADFRPNTGSPVLTGAEFTNAKLAGFTQTTYKGAFDGTDNWLATWTELDPVNAEYDVIKTTGSVNKVNAVLNTNVYPNPTNGITTIEFATLQNTNVIITVSDLYGKMFSTVTKENTNAGTQVYYADFSNLSNGVYFINIQTNEGSKMIKTIVSK